MKEPATIRSWRTRCTGSRSTSFTASLGWAIFRSRSGPGGEAVLGLAASASLRRDASAGRRSWSCSERGCIHAARPGPAGLRFPAGAGRASSVSISARTVARPSPPVYHCGGGRRRIRSAFPAPSSISRDMEFSSAEKNSISGLTREASARAFPARLHVLRGPGRSRRCRTLGPHPQRRCTSKLPLAKV